MLYAKMLGTVWYSENMFFHICVDNFLKLRNYPHICEKTCFHYTLLCLAFSNVAFSNVEEPIDLQLFDVSRMKPRTAYEQAAAYILTMAILFTLNYAYKANCIIYTLLFKHWLGFPSIASEHSIRGRPRGRASTSSAS